MKRSQLVTKYDHLMPEGRLRFGFECQDGWLDLLDQCFERLTELKDLQQVDAKLAQVKEKFGTLRVYLYNSTDLMEDIVSLYEYRSEYTCEVCGERGSVMGEHWLVCRCYDCAVKEGRIKLDS